MHCYQHPQQSAVGICKHCYKGLCHNCASDTGDGLACHEHAQIVNDVNTVIDRSIKAIKDAPVNVVIAPIFTIILGICFVATYFFISKKTETFSLFVVTAGLIFILFGIISIIRNRKIYKNSR